MAGLPDLLHAGPVDLYRWTEDVVDEVLEAVWASLPELREWMPWAQTLPTREDQALVLREGDAAFDAGTDFGFLLREANAQTLVGGCGLHRRVGPGAIEIGYWVRTDCHNRGYATSTAKALTQAAFEYLPDVQRVEIHMDSANLPSARIPQKLGYTLLREEDRDVLTPGHTGRGYVWSASRHEWCPELGTDRDRT